MNAIQFLISEHNKVRSALAEIVNPVNNFTTRKKLFKKLSQDILVHEEVEEKKWYPHFSHRLDARVRHLVKEEKHAANEIKKFDNIKDETMWNDNFIQFRSAVERHAEEEELKLFPEVEVLLNMHELEIIGKELVEYKHKLIKKNMT